MILSYPRALFVLAMLVGIGTAPLALAQQAVPPPAQAPAQQFTDEQLESFAAAVVEVQKVQEQYLPALERAEDAEAAEEIVKEANMAMVEAVQEKGLDPDRFSQIAQAANADPQLRERVSRIIEEQQTD